MADTNDLVSLTEAKLALNITDTNSDTQLGWTITAVSQLLDENCGPIVKRSVTSVATLNAGTYDIGGPVDSVLSVGVFDGTTTTTLVESSTNGYSLARRTAGTGLYDGTLTRTDGLAFTGVVTVVATQGRYTSTAAVHSKFKLAAIDTIRNLWRADEIGVGQVQDFDVPYQTFPAAYAIPNSVRDLLGQDWNGTRNSAHVGVMWG